MDFLIDWFHFPQDLYLINLLAWLGSPYPQEIGQRIARDMQKTQPGSCLLAMQCLEQPELLTFSQPGGRVTQVTANFVLRLLAMDARRRWWWHSADVVVDGRQLDQPGKVIVGVDTCIRNSQPLAPDGKLLVDRLKSGLWLERSQLLLPWNASRERLRELGGQPEAGEADQVSLTWTEESVLGGIPGTVTAQYPAAQARLSCFQLQPESVPAENSPADRLFPEWQRLTVHFGPALESQPGASYRWQLGQISLCLSSAQEHEQPQNQICLQRSSPRG